MFVKRLTCNKEVDLLLMFHHRTMEIDVDTHGVSTRVCRGHSLEPYASVWKVLSMLAHRRVEQEQTMGVNAQKLLCTCNAKFDVAQNERWSGGIAFVAVVVDGW